MQAKSVLYATVGAPVVAVRKVGEGVTVIRTKISDGATEYSKTAEKAIDSWAVEGQKVVDRITDGKVVDEITSKVDLDGAKEQVSKLRDQLEDMLATWRQSFRPEKAADKAEVKTAPKAPAAKKPAAKTTPKASAAKTTRSTAAKTSSAKSESAKADQAS